MEENEETKRDWKSIQSIAFKGFIVLVGLVFNDMRLEVKDLKSKVQKNEEILIRLDQDVKHNTKIIEGNQSKIDKYHSAP